MPDPKIDINIRTQGGQQSAGEMDRVTAAERRMGEETGRLVNAKGRLIDAFKKLQGQVPGLAYALGALKNPFVALTAVIALAKHTLDEFNASMEDIKSAVGDGKISDEFKNIGRILAESKVSAKELAESLREIRDRPETVSEKSARLTEDLERRLAAEEAADAKAKAAELSGVEDPAARAAIEAKYQQRSDQRAQRRLAGAADIAAQAQIAAQNALREGMARLPDEQRRLEQAKTRRDNMLGLAAANTTSPSDLAAINERIAAIEAPGIFNDIKRQATFGTVENMMATYNALKETRDNMIAGNKTADALRATAEGDFTLAKRRYDSFLGGLTSAQEDIRKFSGQRTAANLTADAMAPFNGPTGAPTFDMAAQRRMDTQSNRLAVRQAIDNREIVDAIREIFAELARDIRELKQRERGTAQRE